jgi:DNA-directed RNA polymerase specialized sigma subunit
MTTKKKRRAKKKNNYFTKVHEQAIVQYALTNDRGVRTDLYITYIGPALSELVDKIVYTYKFNMLPNIDYLKDDCKVWLMTILDKYDPEKKSKAFSYFSVITKNWFIHKVKQNSKSLRRNLQFESITGEIESVQLVAQNTYESDRETKEFFMHLFKEIESWEKLKLKDNEKKVLDAIKILFDNIDDIEIFNKKAIYLYMREITGLNTKQIVNSLNRIRKRYRNFKGEWQRGNI